MRATGTAMLVLGCAAALLSMACEGGHYRAGRGAVGYYGGARSTVTTTEAHGFVAGGGTITSTRTVGGYPVSGIYVGPDGTAIYEGTVPYGYGRAHGYPGYGTPGYGTYTECIGAVACGADVSVTTESVSVGVP